MIKASDDEAGPEPIPELPHILRLFTTMIVPTNVGNSVACSRLLCEHASLFFPFATSRPYWILCNSHCHLRRSVSLVLQQIARAVVLATLLLEKSVPVSLNLLVAVIETDYPRISLATRIFATRRQISLVHPSFEAVLLHCAYPFVLEC